MLAVHKRRPPNTGAGRKTPERSFAQKAQNITIYLIKYSNLGLFCQYAGRDVRHAGRMKTDCCTMQRPVEGIYHLPCVKGAGSPMG